MNTPREHAAPRLQLIDHLLTALRAAEIAYTHWKSTTTLDRALAGRTDLDLLVDPRDAIRFQTVVQSIGFKSFVSHPSRRFPGVEDYIGFDIASGRLAHLHVYFRLLLGQQYVKNHRLPIESALIAASIERDGIRVPAPEMELIILTLRTLLKYRDVDAAKDLLHLGRRGGIPPDALSELRDLAGRADRAGISAVMARLLPEVDPAIVHGLMDVVATDARAATRLLRLRRRARLALRPYERLPAMRAWATYMRARIERLWPLKLVLGGRSRRAQRRKTSAGGGMVLAFIGPDGAGKSTLVRAIQEWLAWRVNVSVVYAGSAQPSPSAAILRRGARAARAIRRRVRGGGPLAGIADLIVATRYLADARDRRRRLVAGRRLADAGSLVLVDRYPLPGVQLDGRMVDGPRIGTLLDGKPRGLLRRLGQLEEAVYRQIPPPDHVVVLHTRPETAVARKAHRRPASVHAKAMSVSRMDREGLRVIDVDAEHPFDDVLAQVKQAIWERI